MRNVQIQGVFDPETGDVYIDEEALEEISGYDDEVGALQRLGRGSRRQTRIASRQIDRVRPRAKNKVRVKSGLLGLGTATVAASTDGTLDATAEEPLYLQRLVCDGDTTDFVLEDIKVGAKSIYSGVEPVPSGMFRPDATGAPFSIKQRMRVGQTVTLAIHNNNAGASKTLSAAFKTIEQG